MQPSVKKLPMSIACVDYDYDITSMQPQLFVTANWQQLLDILEEYADTMGFRNPTNEHLDQIIASQEVATIVYASGLQVSGKFTQIDREGHEVPEYIKTEGPSALAVGDIELPGHGTDYHIHGFGSPVGKLINSDKPLEEFNDQDLANHNIISGKESLLSFRSGVKVAGKVESTVRKNGKLVLISFIDCQVKSADGELLFQPDWGTYDMAVGEKIISVFSGTADKEKFNILPGKSDLTAINVQYDVTTKNLFGLYQRVARVAGGDLADTELPVIYSELKTTYPDEWLLRLEILHAISEKPAFVNMDAQIRKDLTTIQGTSQELDNLIASDIA
jgi:phenylalanine-4-hydroxylase